ncbi:RNA polymerase I associated factor, A49-like protein [Moelleriella libera RCEF 2490]|uniref:RNA polymerase I associated factor, A49-like protein n=1 Tax=Moelleriella libera RCEF 2490 TaxID=1081109 RepID=A0A166U449_9HYPO|nr:RNA polymerase I associated factor, A49-like protein [Moelleriella libera RCEF 2490]
MEHVSSKKRKRHGESSGKPKKKVSLDAPASTATISSVLQSRSCPPVIATSPGLEIADDVFFHPYLHGSRSKTSKSRNGDAPEMMLHSRSHRSLNYTAKEEGRTGNAPAVNHFVAIFDPKTGEVELIEGKKMVVRGVVRAKLAPTSSAGEAEARMTLMDRRTDLGQTFGTKKAKKALRENVLNAITPQTNAGESPSKIDDAQKAMLQNVGQLTATMATKEELEDAVREAKLVPKANMDAQDIQDAYDPKVIIGSDILNLVPVREWQEKVQHNEGVTTASRFVAARVNAIANNKDAIIRLRVLRYFSFVHLFYVGAKPGRQRHTRQVPPRDKLRELLAPAPEAVVENIRRKFSDGGIMRSSHIKLLMTSCCVYACIVDNFEVDTQQLREDLRLDQSEVNQFFREIGGQVKPVSNKAEGGHPMHIGRLTLPLKFPQQRHVAPRRK